MYSATLRMEKEGLKGKMDMNIPFVTQGQQDRKTELNKQWEPLKNEYAGLQKKIAAFNTLCREKGVEKITVPGKLN